MRPRVRIVIVNWNAGEMLRECLSSIVQSTGNDFTLEKVVVVDNASDDLDFDQGEMPELPLEIILNDTNRGFAAACNQGAKDAQAEYILFLNPDTKLFALSLTKPVSFMEHPNNASIGICGIRLVDESGETVTSAARYPSLSVLAGKTMALSKLFPQLFPAHLLLPADLNESKIVDQVIGAFFLIRKSLFDQCRGFDEQFFVYFEEVDLSLRAKHLGYASYFLSDVAAFHKGGGCSKRVKAARLFYSLRSRVLYAQKHYSPVSFVLLVLLTGLELPLRLLQGAIRKSWVDVKNTLIAYRHLVGFFMWRS